MWLDGSVFAKLADENFEFALFVFGELVERSDEEVLQATLSSLRRVVDLLAGLDETEQTNATKN